MDDIKITLEVIYDGLKSPNASAMNHTEFLSIDELSDGKKYVELRNNLSGETFTVECQNVIFSVAPLLTRSWKKLTQIFGKNNFSLPKVPTFGLAKKDFLSMLHLSLIIKMGVLSFSFPTKRWFSSGQQRKI